MTTTRDDLALLLPFHVNTTLDADERAAVEAWLAEDPEAADEAETLAAIRRDLQAEHVTSPGEFGLARLMRDIGREGAAPATPAAAPKAANLVQRPWLWQAVAAVAVAGFIGQALLTGGERESDLRYGLAGAEADMAAASLTVAFVPEATEAQIRDLLVGLGVEIVSGPSSLGLYGLSAVDPAEAAAALRAAADIVESVENVAD